MDLSKLNKEQLEAVTHENGPLLIIAGAGTGKTHVITSRILYLLQEKKVSTNSILALTFTEKATEEMIELATEHGICIMESPYTMFRATGLLFQAGLKPVY